MSLGRGAVGPGAAERVRAAGHHAPAPGSFPASFFSSFVELGLPPGRRHQTASSPSSPSLAPAPAGGRTARPAKRWSGARSARGARRRDRRGRAAADAGTAARRVHPTPRSPPRRHRRDRPPTQAAVKALSWCPMHRNLLASGGGTADRTIKFWNAHTGAMLHSVDTGSQVCALLWSRHHKEIVSSHGFSQNQLCLWRYPSMTKLCELTGHTARVLHLAQSPDGETVVSAAADETLRFWSIFGGGPTSAARRKGRMRDMRLSSVGGEMSIR